MCWIDLRLHDDEGRRVGEARINLKRLRQKRKQGDNDQHEVVGQTCYGRQRGTSTGATCQQVAWIGNGAVGDLAIAM